MYTPYGQPQSPFSVWQQFQQQPRPMPQLAAPQALQPMPSAQPTTPSSAVSRNPATPHPAQAPRPAFPQPQLPGLPGLPDWVAQRLRGLDSFTAALQPAVPSPSAGNVPPTDDAAPALPSVNAANPMGLFGGDPTQGWLDRVRRFDPRTAFSQPPIAQPNTSYSMGAMPSAAPAASQPSMAWSNIAPRTGASASQYNPLAVGRPFAKGGLACKCGGEV